LIFSRLSLLRWSCILFVILLVFYHHRHHHHQSIYQSINQSINQSIKQASIDQSINPQHYLHLRFFVLPFLILTRTHAQHATKHQNATSRNTSNNNNVISFRLPFLRLNPFLVIPFALRSDPFGILKDGVHPELLLLGGTDSHRRCGLPLLFRSLLFCGCFFW
jgi:hypothetical protein